MSDCNYMSSMQLCLQAFLFLSSEICFFQHTDVGFVASFRRNLFFTVSFCDALESTEKLQLQS